MSAPSQPRLIVLGAENAGLQVLCAHLNAHPEVAVRESDSEFFTSERSWSRGLDAYRSLFPDGVRVTGECAPSCTRLPRTQGCAERLREALPKLRLVYLMRDPIDRIVEAYVARRTAGQEERTFRAVLSTVSGNDYVDRSRYHMQLEPYWRAFGRERVHLLTWESLRDETRREVRTLYRFLNVDADFFDAGLEKPDVPDPTGSWSTHTWRRLRGWLHGDADPLAPETRPRVDVDMRIWLEQALAADVARLRETTGLSFPGWSM